MWILGSFYFTDEESKTTGLMGEQDERRIAKRSTADVLIIVDAMAASFSMEMSDIFTLTMTEGFSELSSMVWKDMLNVFSYKIIVLMVGRADFWETDKNFKKFVYDALEALRAKNQHVIIVISASLPAPGDTQPCIRTASYRNYWLGKVVNDSRLLDFACPGKNLLSNQGPILDYYDEFHNLNDQGVDQVRRALEGKFRAAKLRKKFFDLKAQATSRN